MGDPITIERIDVRMSSNLQEIHEKPQPGTPFRILIMGDFSGRTNRGIETDGADIGQRPLFRIDRDNDEAVMAKMDVAAQLHPAGEAAPPVALTFREMDDFHPQQIYTHSDIFKSLRAMRQHLCNPDTFAATAARLSAKPSQADDKDDHEPQEPDFSSETTSGLLDQVVDASAPAAANNGKPKPQTDWDRFLSGIVAPYLVPDITREQAAWIRGVDQSIAGMMNTILHHPDIQALESAWRALRFILRRLESGEHLQVDLLDVTQAELASDLGGHEDLEKTAIFKKLVAVSPPATAPWTLLVGMYTFNQTKADAITLARAGAMGQILGAPFIAAAAGSVIGCEEVATSPAPAEWTRRASAEDEKAWQVLRTLPEAGWVGLLLPRFLIRLPYGNAADPVDAFDFEEMPPDPVHDHFLWANPVFALVLMLGRTFSRNGWDWTPGIVSEVDGLPLYRFKQAGATINQPCAETFLSEQAVEKILGHGPMPLVSLRDQDRIRLMGLQSIAKPVNRLPGRWGW